MIACKDSENGDGEFKDVTDQYCLKEERRQKLLELYGIGVMQLVYSKIDSGMWYGCFRLHDDEYETDNFKTRREAEDHAIAEYESISETGDK